METYDVYGIGNALVDTEYEVDDEFLEHAKMTKGHMTLIEADERQKLIALLEDEHEDSGDQTGWWRLRREYDGRDFTARRQDVLQL
ncbi:MAG: hypothetical protein U5O39_02825 [Gammaproteobacteria bacterium]|nr:hypothetical protein [Gammaproteobacteria bacterium]